MQQPGNFQPGHGQATAESFVMVIWLAVMLGCSCAGHNSSEYTSSLKLDLMERLLGAPIRTIQGLDALLFFQGRDEEALMPLYGSSEACETQVGSAELAGMACLLY